MSRDILAIIVKAAKDPKNLAMLGQFAAQLLAGKREYTKLHWGQEGAGATVIEIGSDGPYVALGALGKVAYVTQKGTDREPVLYHHTFKAPLPWLYKNGRGDLIIHRGTSRYRINVHGIIG